MLATSRLTCINCESTLIRNHSHKHWAHCPQCDPVWASWLTAEAERAAEYKPALFGVHGPYKP